MAAVAATVPASGLRQYVALSKSDFTGNAVRQVACPASGRSAGPLTVRASAHEDELRRLAVNLVLDS